MDFSNMKVLVVGDICLDIMTEGKCSRISPEAPVPVILNPNTTCQAGMMGNVAINLANLGAEVSILTAIGNDPEGKILKNILKLSNVSFESQTINLDNKMNTTIKNRIVANGQQVTRMDIESERSIISNEVINMLQDFYLQPSYYDLIVISDYNKGFITKETWDVLCNTLMKANKGNFFVDTKKNNVVDFYEGMILFPNTSEINTMMSYEDVYTANQLRDSLGSDLLVETASDKGAYGYSRFNNYHSRAELKEVIDVTGAGDTFIAAFALYYTKFGNTQRALDFANHCCGKVVSKKGTVAITFEEALQYDFKNK